MAETAIVQQRPAALALASVDPQALISQAIAAGAGIETMERLVALAREVRQMAARDAWYEAMARFQGECPSIYKTRSATIRTRQGGSYAYSFAPLDEIKPKVDPVLAKFGLSARWTSPVIEPTKVTVECLVSHELGHSESSGPVTMPIIQGQEDTGANPMQRVAIAMTYAKRYSLLNILGLAPEADEDGGGKGNGQEPTAAEASAAGPSGDALINEGQVRRFYAIARGTKPVAWTDEQITKLLNEHSYETVKAVKLRDYDTIVDLLKAGPGKPATGGTQGNLA